MRRRTLQPNFIVGIGGSAGSLNAYKALLDSMPSNMGMAFVIVSHLMPTANSQLAGILSSKGWNNLCSGDVCRSGSHVSQCSGFRLC